MSKDGFGECRIGSKPKEVPLGICGLSCPKKDFVKCEMIRDHGRIEEVNYFLSDFEGDEKTPWIERLGWINDSLEEPEKKADKTSKKIAKKTAKKTSAKASSKTSKTKDVNGGESYIIIGADNNPAVRVFGKKDDAVRASDELANDEVPHTCLGVSDIVYSDLGNPEYVIIENEKTPILCNSVDRLADICENIPDAKIYRLGPEVKVSVNIEIHEVGDE